MNLAARLRLEILAEQLRHGEKLAEQSLAERYGVSRTPIREALKILETEGLVAMVPNRGAFVVGLTAADLRDLYAIRMQSEMQAVRWAVERRTKAEMETIEETLDFMRFYTERCDAGRMRAINADFHKHITLASHNRMLIESISRIQDYIRYSAKVRPYAESQLAEILEEHKEIFATFKANNPEQAAKAMQAHIKNSQSRANL